VENTNTKARTQLIYSHLSRSAENTIEHCKSRKWFMLVTADQSLGEVSFH